jgi:hypothetical protein
MVIRAACSRYLDSNTTLLFLAFCGGGQLRFGPAELCAPLLSQSPTYMVVPTTTYYSKQNSPYSILSLV